MENIIITIARQYGSGGKTIGYMLAKELGIPCYSREILEKASEESGINVVLFNQADEKLKRSPKFLLSTNVYSGELLPPESREFTSDLSGQGHQGSGGAELLRYDRQMCRFCAQGFPERGERLCARLPGIQFAAGAGAFQHDPQGDGKIYRPHR